MNLYKRIGFLFFLALASFSPLLAQESLEPKLAMLEEILVKLENELLNSKGLLLAQTLELDNLNQDLVASETTIKNLNLTIKSSRNNIKILESTILELKKEIALLQTQTGEVSTSLEKASISFEKYVTTTKIVAGVGGTILLALAIALTYKIIEDK